MTSYPISSCTERTCPVALRHCAESPRATKSWATTLISHPARHLPERQAAIRTLQIFERDHIVAHAKRLGNIAAGIMREWETYSIVRQARGNGLLLGVSFGKPETAGVDEKDWWTARAVRGKMLENGVWALSDRQETIRMYPALNMDESVLREGLQIMEDAIRHVEKRGHTEGDAAAYPSGVAGF